MPRPWKMLLHYSIKLLLVALVHSVNAQPLVVSVGDNDSEPYAFIVDGELKGGIIKDILDELAPALDVKFTYSFVPRKRISSQLLEGKTDIHLIMSPKWLQNPEQFQWTIPLFRETGRIVVSALKPFRVQSYADLVGKWVGTIHGYYYPGLMQQFANETIIRDDAESLEVNFKRLQLGYIDCLIDSDILINYYIESHRVQERFIITDKIVSQHEIRAMISPSAPIRLERINEAIQRMKNRNRIQQILDKYR